MDSSVTVTCKACQQESEGKFCRHCGQSLAIKKVTLSYLLHEVFHFFTHVDRGLGYTLRQLIIAPGFMQRDFLAGNRSRNQKPFSMYFLSASVMAVVLYWINYVIVHYYHARVAGEVIFFNKYLVMLLLAVIPLSTLFTYIFFYNSEYGFAEIGVMQLYTLSIFFLIVMIIQFLKFIWPDMETRNIELPAILIYNVITFKNFFHYQRKWKVILKSIICAGTFFFTVGYIQDIIVDYLN